MATSTVEAHELPWGAHARVGRTRLELVIAWSLDEPARVGEAAVVDRPLRLGRGEPEDRGAHARFRPWRPGAARGGHPLESPRLSREQLRLTPEGGGRLRVENIGRCPMLIDGVEQGETLLRPGDLLQLRNTLILLLVERGELPEAVDVPDFPFGGPDRAGLVGESEAIWRLRRDLSFAARSAQHVLLLGPSGAGKELAARALHALSRRADRPLVARNASTLPDGLVDAELFGSARGYPHAGSPERPGLIGQADGGTLFLDEIGELPAAQQAHLLRVLDQGGEYHRLGDARLRRADLRLIAATNRPLGALKHDFGARFPLRVEVPGLDERPEDIPLLAQAMLARARVELGEGSSGSPIDGIFGPDGRARLHPQLVEALLRHRYSLHARELLRLLWLALSGSPGDHLALSPALSAELGPREERRPAEPPGREAVEAALAAAGGRASLAAEALGLSSRFVLYRLMKKYGLGGEAPGEEPATAGPGEGGAARGPGRGPAAG